MATVPADKAHEFETKAAAQTAAAVPVIETKPVVAPVAVAPVTASNAITPKVEAKLVVAPAAKPVAPALKIVAKAAPKRVAKAKKTMTDKVVKTRTVKPKAAPVAASKGKKTMTDTVKNVAADVSEKATEMFKDMNTRAKAAFEKAGSFTKDSTEFNKANIEAFVESAKIAAKGMQTVAQNAAEFGRKNFEATSTMVKAAAAVKSPTDLFKLQGDFARSQFDGVVAEMSKSSEFTLKLVGEIFQPIQSRYAVAAEEMKTRLAA